MKLFLDASVLLAAAGSTEGASRAIFTYAADQNWMLISSPWALSEALRNLPNLPAAATADW
jgi:predicted nucleic acid-binding protein